MLFCSKKHLIDAATASALFYECLQDDLQIASLSSWCTKKHVLVTIQILVPALAAAALTMDSRFLRFNAADGKMPLLCERLPVNSYYHHQQRHQLRTPVSFAPSLVSRPVERYCFYYLLTE